MRRGVDDYIYRGEVHTPYTVRGAAGAHGRRIQSHLEPTIYRPLDTHYLHDGAIHRGASRRRAGRAGQGRIRVDGASHPDGEPGAHRVRRLRHLRRRARGGQDGGGAPVQAVLGSGPLPRPGDAGPAVPVLRDADARHAVLRHAPGPGDAAAAAEGGGRQSGAETAAAADDRAALSRADRGFPRGRGAAVHVLAGAE